MAVDLGKVTEYSEGKESVVIKKYLDGIEGGKVLDNTEFTPTTIQAGHVAIKETSTGKYKPLPISGVKFAELPEEHKFAGIVVNTMPADRAMCGIMTQGAVNYKAMPYDATDILDALRVALNNIEFRSDLE